MPLMASWSPPSRGAWIEIPTSCRNTPAQSGRPPRGGRGLKFPASYYNLSPQLSPPSRGAWIEIFRGYKTPPKPKVAPLAGGVD